MTPQPNLKLADDTTRKLPRRFRFTVASLGRVKPPTSGRAYVYDLGEPGLAMLTTSSDHRAWYFYRKVNGRPVRLKLGDVADLSIENARKLARKHKGAIAEGRDPAEERRIKRGEMTLAELWKLYCDEHAALNCTPNTRRADKSLYETCLRDKFGARRLSGIKPAEVKAQHTVLSKRGTTTANRAIQLLRRLYRFASDQYDLDLKPPTASVKPNNEESRGRFLNADELQRFFAALEPEEQIWCDFFHLCVYTGARRGNIQAMKWADVDLKSRMWTIPGTEFKNRTTTAIALPDEAVNILRRRCNEADNDTEWVFPAQRVKTRKDGVKTEHVGQPTSVWRRILRRSGIKNLRMHDLRRTKGAWMASAGASLTMIGTALGHKDHRATQIYSRLTDEAARQHSDKVAKAMAEIINARGIVDRDEQIDTSMGKEDLAECADE